MQSGIGNSQQTEQELLNEFVERRKQGLEQYIPNDQLPAGSMMNFHCNHCLVLTGALPEDYNPKHYRMPPSVCGDCEKLKSQNLLAKAEQLCHAK